MSTLMKNTVARFLHEYKAQTQAITSRLDFVVNAWTHPMERELGTAGGDVRQSRNSQREGADGGPHRVEHVCSVIVFERES